MPCPLAVDDRELLERPLGRCANGEDRPLTPAAVRQPECRIGQAVRPACQYFVLRDSHENRPSAFCFLPFFPVDRSDGRRLANLQAPDERGDSQESAEAKKLSMKMARKFAVLIRSSTHEQGRLPCINKHLQRTDSETFPLQDYFSRQQSIGRRSRLLAGRGDRKSVV